MVNKELTLAQMMEAQMLSQEHPLLSNLPHSPIDLEEKLKEVRKQVRKGERFDLKDLAGDYTVKTYAVARREYVTLLLDIEPTGGCMPPHRYKTLDSLHTRSMRGAIQLHYDALGHYDKLKNGL